MANIIFKGLSFAIIGAAMEVHNVLGSGFLEKVYQKALAHELTLRGIPFEEYKRLTVHYKGVVVGDYEADFVVDEKIILEIKSVASLHPKHEVQTLNYLTATGFKLGLVINFGEQRLHSKRVVN